MSRDPITFQSLVHTAQEIPSKPSLQVTMINRSEALEHRRRVRLLAEGLMVSLNIVPYERHLVVWLGNSASSNNQDAVMHWVAQTLLSLRLDIRTVDPKYLRRCLVQYLDSLREEME